MWNKIFKHKSLSSSSSHKDNHKNGKIDNNGNEGGDNNEFISNNNYNKNHNIKSESIPVSNSTPRTKSKFSKVVNSFSLKRGLKGKNVTDNSAMVSAVLSSSMISNSIDCLNGNGFLDKENVIRKKDHDKMNELLVMDGNHVNDDDSNVPINLELKPCPICTRTFVPDTLKKHVIICEKMAQKKRKIFDSSKQRREGTDLADFLPKGFGLPESKKQHLYNQQLKHDSCTQSHQQKQKCSTDSEQQTLTGPLVLSKQNDDVPLSEPLSVPTITPTQRKHSNSSISTISTATSKSPSEAKLKAERKRSLLPPSEPCPYCERRFGTKAYDRHVEWCKEKSKLLVNQKNTTKTPAKERLEARIRYRAPCLKSKRAANREKYSGLSCDDSFSLMDGFNENSKTSLNDQQKFSMSTSLNSSIMSESGISDKYDPFLSAKRQLEELCSPTSTEPPITPTTPNSMSKLSSSYTAPSVSSSRNNSNTTNFRRTSSLRVSRKKTTPSFTHHPSRPLFCTQSKDKPTIQRGISDEGPISSSFLKPEEYDEMPVKSACVNDLAISTHHHHHHHSSSPKIVKRDMNSSMNRRNLRLNLNNSNNTNKGSSLSASAANPVSKTDSLAIFLKYENETKNNSGILVDAVSSSYSPSSSTTGLTEKDLKDKTNTTLSKNQMLSSSTSSSTVTTITSTNTNKLLPSINSQIDCKNNFSIDNTNNSNSNRIKEINSIMTVNKMHPIKLEPLTGRNNIISLNSVNLQDECNNKNNLISPLKPLNLNSILLDTTKDSNDFIDPKLINVCDNLPINITKFSDSDITSSSTDSVSTTKYTNLETINSVLNTNQQLNQYQHQHHQQQNQIQQLQKQMPTKSNRNSSEKRNLLKRQLRLGKNQFLYDMSPDDDDDDDDDCVVIDSYSDHLDKTISLIDADNDDDIDDDRDHDRLSSKRRHCNRNKNKNGESPTFDDFDFEEFLSSFNENDEKQYPIFKDYKEFLMMNRSFNKNNQNQQKHNDNSNGNNNNNNNSSNSSSSGSSNNNNNSIDRFAKEKIPKTPKKSQEIKKNDDYEEHDEFYDNDDIDIESRKNEIFISIETNQTTDENEMSSISPTILPLGPSSKQHDNDNKNDNDDNDDDDEDEDNHKKIIETEKYRNDYKSDKISHNYVDNIRNNKTKIFNEQNEIHNNDELKLTNLQHQQQQEQSKQKTVSSSINSDNIIFQLRDSDEICSSIDENFSLHERNSSIRSKQNSDSAYGSLSRHSPIDSSMKKLLPLPRNRLQSAPLSRSNHQSSVSPPTLNKSKYTTSVLWNENKSNRIRNFSISSSGSSSDNSLPAVPLSSSSSLSMKKKHNGNEGIINNSNNNNNDGDDDDDDNDDDDKLMQQQSVGQKSFETKMSKFCHECGSKFLLSQAKFCMECGVKRIILE